MAHVVVYLQRTPQGLHPASALALCWARDICTERGASLTAICLGDAGPVDEGITAAAGRFGADQIVFGGPNALGNMCERLNPAHIVVPWTQQGRAAVEALPSGPPCPRWIDTRTPEFAGADAITGVVAGLLPWHRFELELEPEYEGDVGDVPMPEWIEAARGQAERGQPLAFQVAGAGDVAYVSPGQLDRTIEQRLHALGGTPSSWEAAATATHGTFICLAPAAGPLPPSLASRGAGARIILLPGPNGNLDPSWCEADWVLPGPWPEVLDELLSGPWETSH